MILVDLVKRILVIGVGWIGLTQPVSAQNHSIWSVEELALVTTLDGAPVVTELDNSCMTSCFEKNCRKFSSGTAARSSCVEKQANDCTQRCYNFLYSEDDEL